MCWVERSPFDVAADDVTAFLLTLDQAVVMWLADALMIVRINEQCPVSSVRYSVIHDRCFGHELGLEAAFTEGLAG